MLQMTRVQKEDAGRYTCQAVNEAGEDHMHFELHILGMYVLHRSHCRRSFCESIFKLAKVNSLSTYYNRAVNCSFQVKLGSSL